MNVKLTWHELSLAAAAGVRRNLEARRLGRPDTYGKDVSQMEGGWGVHIEGAAAEMAVAKATGSYWDPVWSEIDRSRGDVGRYQVRSTMRENGCLILHPQDRDEDTFVLVTGIAPEFVIRGCILARDGKDERHWRTDTGRPAFFVPQAALFPISQLETHRV